MMHLEMEQAESSVGKGKKKSQKSDDSLIACFADRSFMTKVVGFACLALLIIVLRAGNADDNSIGDSPADLSPPSASVAIDRNDFDEDDDVGVNGDDDGNGDDDYVENNDDDGSVVSDDDDDVQNNDNDNSFTYSKRATIVPLADYTPPEESVRAELTDKWGKWGFYDGAENSRPSDDYCAKYPNRDIPGDKFPDEAWQTDAVFVNHYLNDADKIISRAMEAIFTEYGRGKPLPPEKLSERRKMFHWGKLDLATQTTPPEKYQKGGDRGNGGWTTKRSFDGLVRRLLHAMMTSDTFTVVMGGHSAAAGQGNHFRQSYMMQFHKIMSPIFARLGVKLVTRNMAQGGMGTIQFGIGSGGIYGDEVDLILWDSGMTENGNPHHIDVFLRQALIGGNRVPVVWGGNFDLLRMLHENADADVGEYGNGMDGIPFVENAEQANSIPWPARYLKCNAEVEDLCAQDRFCAKCWIDRDDGIKPQMPQLDSPRGQVKWHPGWRAHQLQGRVLAFALLEALQSAVNVWSEGTMGGPPLDDSYWHVTEYYENIRSKVKSLDKSLGHCYNIEENLPSRICNTPMKAKTQYTPRADYYGSSLTSIIKPAKDGYVPSNDIEALYSGPDAYNGCLQDLHDSIDVYSIVSGRRLTQADGESDVIVQDVSVPIQTITSAVPDSAAPSNATRILQDAIEPGSGWQVFGEPQGYCDGTYNAVCARQTDIECVLYGHHDARGAIVGNEYSGWLVLTLKDLEEGIIVIKLHTWHYDSENTRTKGWTAVNNVQQRRQLLRTSTDVNFQNMTKPNAVHFASGTRGLMRSYETPELPESFQFEYAIDGKITTLSKGEFLNQKKQVQRVVETMTLLDDPNFTQSKRDVEVAIRLRGCGRECTFGLSHIYWA